VLGLKDASAGFALKNAGAGFKSKMLALGIPSRCGWKRCQLAGGGV
jgi:hypothetical protein